MQNRREAIVAGILSGLGIRPRRMPRSPLERLDAAIARATWRLQMAQDDDEARKGDDDLDSR